MKRLLQFFAFLFLLLIAFVAHTLTSTGYFRDIEPHFDGEIVQKIKIVGAEDMTINKAESFMLISSDDRAATKKGKPKQGGIYWMDLQEEAPFEAKLISGNFKEPFHPHGISLLQLDSVNYKLWVINHVNGKHSVEVFHLQGDSLTHLQTLKHEKMISPNDILAVGEETFYFTNDHTYLSKMGSLVEGYLGLAAANVMYFDGGNYRMAADGIAYANGINWDEKRNLLFVAAARGFLLKVYQKAANGDLTFVEDIDCHTGVDNIEVDSKGDLWIGAHPSLMAYTAYADFKEDKAPSEILKMRYKSKGDHTIESVFLDDGSNMSGSSVATTNGEYLFLGNVMDPHILIVKAED
ncbi:MAG: SMP-30/gluconolactonase/LRE family protein [Chitinophagales bacterium]